MKKSTYLLLLAFLTATGIFADEGRIPIFQPTTIRQPGHYVLTRDISVSGGDVIVIEANNVTLDLNGHTVFSAAASGFLIVLQEGFTNAVIRNGRLLGVSAHVKT